MVMECLYEDSFGNLEMKSVILGIIAFEMPIRQPSREESRQLRKKSLEFKKEVWAAEILLGGISL